MKSLSIPFLAVLATIGASLNAGGQKPPVIEVRRPTIVAFFVPASDSELSNDSDRNETLNDFQLYASNVREPLKKAGIDFREIYARRFEVRIGKQAHTVKSKSGVGYYLVAPGKKPRTEYGVMTDTDLLQVADEYFAIKHNAGSSP